MMNPALLNQRNFVPQGYQYGSGALSPTAMVPAPAALSGNARGSVRMPQVPQQRINMGGEGLMRIGMAGMGASNQGPMAQFGAMGDMYGQLMDYNRAREMDEFAIQEAQALEQQRRQELQAKLAREAEEDKEQPMGPPTAAYSEAALSAIEAVEDNLANETWNPFTKNTGFFGNIMQAVPGTPAHDTAASINTIEAAIGFDRLQAMRDASPTGGALGQVSEMELRQLNASLGSLRQSSSKEQFAENLAAVKKHYMAAVAAIKAQQYEYARMNGLPLPGNNPSNNGEITFDPATGKFSDE
jgi:hypothetical protein